MKNILIKSGSIFDGLSKEPYKGYVYVKGNKIVSVGRWDHSNHMNEHRIGDDTIIIDAGNKTVLPGFHDSHTHLIMSGLYRITANLAHARSEEEAVKSLTDYYENHDTIGDFILGFGWHHVFWDNRKLPTKDSLDKNFPDKPVFLLNSEAHAAWVNSKALEIAGITKDTPNPFGGEIARDENGEPTGFLSESALGLVTKYAMQFSHKEQSIIIKSYMDGAKKLGITSVIDVMPYFHGNMGDIPLYSEFDRIGALSVRIHTAPDLLGDLDEVLEWKNKYESDKLKVGLLKQFMDGVIPGHTALMIEDYSDAEGNRGTALFDIEAIEKAVMEAHKRGLSVKLHACGDLSVRLALDYYERALNMYGNMGCRHAIEHCEIVSNEDIPRFGKLDVIACVQPEHLAITQTYEANPYPKKLGNRVNQTWPLKSLLDSSAVLAFGSDCPVVDNNPFLEIYRAVTRVHNDGNPIGGWIPEQKLTLAESLRAYTFGSAYAVGRELEIGTLEANKLADIIILDRNIFEIPESEILETQVKTTIFDGKVIFNS